MKTFSCNFVAFVLLANTLFIEPSLAIKCYSCTVDTCHTFDESAQFETNCEHSTMCLKKIYPYRLNNGETIETIIRGCASQLDLGMELENGDWKNTRTIIELAEQCATLKKDSDEVSCHCRGDRCNGATATTTHHLYTIATMIVVTLLFNSIKCL